jgi:antibiotic biosynthesis monooxygenase (ABM) superfamily enzyme
MGARAAFVIRLLLLWIGAYTTLMIIFILFGDVLNAWPLPLRVLAVSAVLVLVMSQLVFPLAIRIVSRLER